MRREIHIKKGVIMFSLNSIVPGIICLTKYVPTKKKSSVNAIIKLNIILPLLIINPKAESKKDKHKLSKG